MTAWPQILLSADEIGALVAEQARLIAPHVDDETVAVCLLTGGLWYAADLTRALAAEGCVLRFDALWMASYHDERASSGRCEIRGDLQRPAEGRRVLVIDDVFDSGLSLREAHRHLQAAGAAGVLSAVFARKPWPAPRALTPDFVAWEAPARFLVGYGMDDGGRWRGLNGIGALD